MAKKNISATIDSDTEIEVNKHATKIDRSFSKTVDILLKKALNMNKKKK